MPPALEKSPAAPGRCARCGRPAAVAVVSEDEAGERQIWELCLECAETPPRPQGGRALLRVAPSVLVRSGILLAALALFADAMGIRGQRGFGWRQLAGSESGALLLALGAFLRSGWLSIGGLALLVLSLGADHLRLGRTPGLGWREQAALGLGVAAVGLLWQRRLRAQAGGRSPAREGRG